MSVRVTWICDQCGNEREKALDGPSPLVTPPGWSSKWGFGVWSHTCAACAGIQPLPGFGGADDDAATPSTDQQEDGE